MSASDLDDYVVLVNDEEQYSLWPSTREVPRGWRQEGARGSQQDCLSHIQHVWTDMRPKSLRETLQSAAR
ncbi:MAG: MbtH family NRPS accessory protein [Myxococcales bacterium]|nr:MAG: MbtH family NRPS accessory protein [Myxococcales bacterium]